MCTHCVLIREHHDCQHATQQQLNKKAQEVQQAGYFPASWGDMKCVFPRQQSIVILHSKLKSTFPLSFYVAPSVFILFILTCISVSFSPSLPPFSSSIPHNVSLSLLVCLPLPICTILHHKAKRIWWFACVLCPQTQLTL